MPELQYMAHLYICSSPTNPPRTSPSWRPRGGARGLWLGRLLLSLEGLGAVLASEGGLLEGSWGHPDLEPPALRAKTQ